MSSYDWEKKFSRLDIEQTYEKFIEIYNHNVENLVPKFKTKNSNRNVRPEWINNDLKSLCRKKFELWNKIRASANKDELKKDYRLLSKNSKNSPKLLFSYINKQAVCKDEIRSLLHCDGQ
ncbi:unnamed protein product [Brachionus calyciflorus]|uniref:Uncharacterized protein n=1 Tax=Brachionus calyciflorus TaxID=104777 RepID=A0A814LYA8_9BILA|nr:unnamed protein product [Brachionus calyciflorus]